MSWWINKKNFSHKTRPFRRFSKLLIYLHFLSPRNFVLEACLKYGSFIAWEEQFKQRKVQDKKEAEKTPLKKKKVKWDANLQ